MTELLRPGQVVRAERSNLPCEVEAFLGGGGQGEVYRARLAGTAVALKWYRPHAATPAQRAALDTLVKIGPPAPQFLWPEEIASATGVPSFGYVMPLREPRFRSIVDLMKRRIEPSFRALATAGLALSHSFLQLHARGLCYRDISFGNVFFDSDTGDVLICDNDNVGVDAQPLGTHGSHASGAPRSGNAASGSSVQVLGTPRFMAPEIVHGEALPSTQTDLYSLAVLLFYMLVVHHPLEGKREAEIRCLDLPAMTRLYGTDPLFIFDPTNADNRPVPGLHDNALAFWSLYPAFARDIFTRAFTSGLHDPQHGRVRESEWRAAMVRLRDSIIHCAGCGAESFYDAATLRDAGALPLCWACGATVPLPARIRIGRNVVMLNHDAFLFPHHLDDQRLYDFSRPVAGVTRHPTDPQLWGLKNLSPETWTTGASYVPPGRSVSLVPGTRIHFGRVEGEIRA